MICRYCGMDAPEADACAYCKMPASPAPPAAPAAQPASPVQSYAPQSYVPQSYAPLGAQPLTGGGPRPLDLTQPVPPPLDLTQPVALPVGAAGAPQVRVSLTGEVIEVAPPAPQPMPGHFSPPQPVPGLAVTGGPPMPPSVRGMARDIPAGAVSAQQMQQALRWTNGSPAERWDKCLAMLLPLVLVGVLTVHFLPTAYFWIEVTTLFFAALIMGATGAVGSYDSAFVDCTAVLIVSYVFGPLAGFGAVLLLGAVKQELNPSIALLLLGHVLIRFCFLIAAMHSGRVLLFGPDADWNMLMLHISLYSVPALISFFVICSTFAGWMFANFFRPVNDVD